MRAKARHPFTCYHNYELHTFKAGDELEGAVADYAVATLCPVDVLDEDPAAVGEDGELDVTVTATAAALVLAWVGDDPDRAAGALAAEQASAKPRTGLLKSLAKLIPQSEATEDGAATADGTAEEEENHDAPPAGDAS